MKDCCHIHRKNVEYLKTRGKKVELIYTENDLYDCFNKFTPMEVGKRIEIDSNLHVELRYNSHTLGSCNATIYIKKPSNKRWYSIVYTSDMGTQINKKHSYYLQDQNVNLKCDLFISEATYSDSSRELTPKITEQERREFIRIIKEGLQSNKRILLPTFAFSRSQLIITTLFNELKDEEWFVKGDYEIIMDGVLMNNINTVYSRVLKGEDKKLFDDVMSWKKLRKIKDYKASLEFLKVRKPSVILASSGFLENGKINLYLPHILNNSKDIVVVTGYCSQDNEGSMGWKLLNDQKTITFNIDGEKKTILKRATVYQQKSWTSHISNSELKELFASVDCSKIIIHHCNEENKDKFIAECKEYLRSKNKTTRIIATGKGCNQFVL